jgi:CBS domain-containing protein
MTETPACCGADTSLQQVARLMIEHDCGAIPVIEGRDRAKPVGIITDRDITCRAVAMGKNPLELTARDCMSSPVCTIEPSADVNECCDSLEQNQVRRILVVDSDGCCCGIVSQADVARHASSRKTAEVVKEVSQPAMA